MAHGSFLVLPDGLQTACHPQMLVFRRFSAREAKRRQSLPGEVCLGSHLRIDLNHSLTTPA
jgi:hypothetical protein